MHRCFICYLPFKSYYQLLPEKEDFTTLKKINIDPCSMETIECCGIYFLYYRLCEQCLDTYLNVLPNI